MFRTSCDFMVGKFRQQACHSENAGDLSDEMRAAFGASFNADVAAAAEFELRRRKGEEASGEEIFTLAKHGWDMDFKFGQEMEFDWGPIKANVVMSRTGESSIRRVIKLNNGKTILTTYDFDEDIVTKRQTVEGVTATRVYKRV